MRMMSARQTIHELVDELPESELPKARRILEGLRSNGDQRAARDNRDQELINAHADELNKEAVELQTFQADT